MKASELRIGNLLEFSNCIQPAKTVVVGRRFFSSAAIEREDDDFEITPYYRPIPLTEEWLLKAVFSDKDYKRGYIGKDFKSGSMTLDFVLSKPLTKGEWNKHYTFDIIGSKFVNLEYVHQLQNLYFALTGEELTFKTIAL